MESISNDIYGTDEKASVEDIEIFEGDIDYFKSIEEILEDELDFNIFPVTRTKSEGTINIYSQRIRTLEKSIKLIAKKEELHRRIKNKKKNKKNNNKVKEIVRMFVLAICSVVVFLVEMSKLPSYHLLHKRKTSAKECPGNTSESNESSQGHSSPCAKTANTSPSSSTSTSIIHLSSLSQGSGPGDGENNNPLPEPGDVDNFKCHHPGCNRSFPTYELLKLHLQAHKDEETPFSCPFTGCKRFKSKEELMDHGKNDHHVLFSIDEKNTVIVIGVCFSEEASASTKVKTELSFLVCKSTASSSSTVSSSSTSMSSAEAPQEAPRIPEDSTMITEEELQKAEEWMKSNKEWPKELESDSDGSSNEDSSSSSKELPLNPFPKPQAPNSIIGKPLSNIQSSAPSSSNTSSLSTEQNSDFSELESRIHSSSRKTRLEVALASETSQSIEALVSDYINTSPDWRKKQEAWILPLFVSFCKATGQPRVFPTNGATLASFATFLAVKCSYSVGTIDATIVPCLVHMHIVRTGQVMDKKEILIKNETIRKLRSNPNLIQMSDGKEPIIKEDLNRILSCIHPVDFERAFDSSMFLFMFSTGCRGVSVDSIRLCDIENFVYNEEAKVWSLTINIEKQKAQPHWHQPVTLEGSPNVFSLMDPVYWIQQHLKTSHNTTIQKQLDANREGNGSQKKMWPISIDNIRQRLKNRLRNAGFPPERFGNHSFRSGFLCSALLHAEDSMDVRTAVMESCAMVAGWTTGSRHMKRYAKRCLKKQIVCTRIVGLSSSANNKNTIMREGASKSESMHSFKLKEPMVPTYIFTWAFTKQLRRKITWPGASNKMLSELHKMCTNASVEYLGRTEKAKIEDLPSPEVATSTYGCAVNTRGYAYIRRTLMEKPSLLPSLIQKSINMLKETGRLKRFKQTVKQKYKESHKDGETEASLTEDNSIAEENMLSSEKPSVPKPKNRRIEWTEEESNKLIELVKSGLTMKEIAKQMPNRRKNCIHKRYSLMKVKAALKGTTLPDIRYEPKISYRVKREKLMPLASARKSFVIEKDDNGDTSESSPHLPRKRSTPFSFKCERELMEDELKSESSEFKPFNDMRDRALIPHQSETESESDSCVVSRIHKPTKKDDDFIYE